MALFPMVPEVRGSQILENIDAEKENTAPTIWLSLRGHECERTKEILPGQTTGKQKSRRKQRRH